MANRYLESLDKIEDVKNIEEEE